MKTSISEVSCVYVYDTEGSRDIFKSMAGLWYGHKFKRIVIFY